MKQDPSQEFILSGVEGFRTSFRFSIADPSTEFILSTAEGLRTGFRLEKQSTNKRSRIRWLDLSSDNRKSRIQNLKWSDCRSFGLSPHEDVVEREYFLLASSRR